MDKEQTVDRLTVGDYFTHDRTGARFVCRAVTRHDYDGNQSAVRAEVELALRKDAEKKIDGEP